LSEHAAFEALIQRVYQSLAPDQRVELNARIPDPDVEGAKRQVDVVIHGIDTTTFVECRKHSAKQDVKWVEELIGRKDSLRPDLMIGVSASGFSQTAIKKAAAKGILLRDVEDISPSEIKSWVNRVQLEVRYARFDSVSVGFNLPARDLQLAQSLLFRMCSDGAMSRILTGVASSLTDRFDVGMVATFEENLKVDLGVLSATPQITTRVSGVFRLEAVNHWPVGCFVSKPSGVSVADQMGVQFDGCGNELHFGPAGGFWHIDMSKFELQSGCIPTGEYRLDLGESRAMHGVQVVGYRPQNRMINNCKAYII